MRVVLTLNFWVKLVLSLLLLTILGLIYLDAVIRDKFADNRWSLPARVYARPLELYTGVALSADEFERELRSLGYRRVKQVSNAGGYQRNGEDFLVYRREFTFWDADEPALPMRLSFKNQKLVRLSSVSYQSLGVERLEPMEIGSIYPAHNEDRILVRLEQVPEHLLGTLVAIEDRNFFHHSGISLRGIARAMRANLRSGRVAQGGSTLTQQLVKNFFLTQERSLWRKLVEIPMALLLELHYSKEEILQAYLNEIYLGQEGIRAIHGFGLASRYYFNKPIESVSLAESALLVAIVKGPSYYNPRRFPERAKARRNLVLDLLAEQTLISPNQAQAAKQQPLGLQMNLPGKTYAGKTYPAYLDLVKQQLKRDYPEEQLTSEGLKIYTSFAPLVQYRAEQALSKNLDYLEKYYQLEANSLQGAVVVSAVQSGEVEALVGDRKPRFLGFNRALYAQRPIGSLVKPAVYLAALNQPEQFTLASLLPDEPVEVVGEDGKIWQPRNFDRIDHGQVPLHQALAKSYNQATAHLAMQLGIAQVTETLRQLGVEQQVPNYPSVSLGAINLTPLAVAQVYQTIASRGFYSPLRTIQAVTNKDGQLLSSYHLAVEQRFSDQSMHLLLYSLQSVFHQGTAQSAYKKLDTRLNLAGKTGTTNNQRDSWFAGFSGDRLAVAWVGRDDNKMTPLTGSRGALRVWTDLMAGLTLAPYLAPIPERIKYYWVNQETGLLSHEGCKTALLLPFVEGTQPQQKDNCRPQRGNKKGAKKGSWFSDLF